MMLFGLQWDAAYWLLLLPLALLPWFNHNLDKTVAWVSLVPNDPVSRFISIFLKSMTTLAMASLLLALAAPEVPEKKVERLGEGAEIVLLLDRSRSMDDPFAVKTQAAAVSVGGDNSKRRIAKDYLTEFVRKRPDDRFGFVFFSTKSVNLLPLTYSKDATLATIAANALGKGLSDTNMADALLSSAKMFENQTYRGSRIVLLVSDGGQQLSEQAKTEIAALYQQENLSIYWIYLKSRVEMSLEPKPGESALWSDIPERKLHDFFQSIDVPYRAFEAGSLKSFADALDEIDRQQYQPLLVQETLPHEPKSDVFLWLALFALLILAASHTYSYWGVQKAHE
ncbi:MxaC, protein involved in Ca2+ insertion into methanol dehydrogenase [Methylophaga frappieri]|uniref:MxaC, protein involved in Ca2+ insertion into methanol dehydrogenase n=1 Tax=Methylophaga frappieri (strain ATCC BAA-2434 / DSM 25690 / JAM7) TaxID=754477 RepID=I1YEY6_METFJ|nr:vWA domain-containing protein [Methylophaga frappieri]AFJ01479.1 MxaC, protein involved in Ca2+ insertion into methanol dehydrogenase [Methylophaga frappieri]